MRSTIQCFAHGRPGEWEAICVDLDIAVQGRSLEEVQHILLNAIGSYVEDAMREDPENRDRLLNRRAPWHVRMSYAIRFVFGLVFARTQKDEGSAGYNLPCPA